MQQRTVEPGHRFAGRYRLEDLLDDVEGLRSWRAIDELLGRPVLIQTVPLADHRAADISRAGRAAALSTDPRLLRVLDISTEGEHAYLVREWIDGVNLATLLVDGPLPPDQAGVLACEVAEALTAAHGQGLAHRCLDPTSVVISRDGAIRIVGLATRAVMHPPVSDDPAHDDVLGIGRVLYAALTARWPGSETYGLSPAPLVEGHLASPRQVRAGVPRALDELVDRLLGDPPRHGYPPIRTPAEAATLLRSVCPPAPPSGLRTLTVNRSVDYDDSPPALVAIPESHTARAYDTSVLPITPPITHRRPPRRSARVLGVVSAAAFLMAIVLIGLQLLDPGSSPAPAQTSAPTTSPTPTMLTIERALAYDPLGDGEEGDRRTGQAVDGDPNTQWQTQTYFDPLEIQKAGVGLVLDLGKPVELARLQLTLADAGGSLEIRAAAADAMEVPEDPDDWINLASRDDPPTSLEVDLAKPVTSRFVLVWFTKLPQVGSGEWRAAITEAQLLG